MPQIIAHMTEIRRAHALRRDVVLRGDDASIFFEFEGDILPRNDGRLDFLVPALVFRAMLLGRDLHVDGPVSAQLLDRIVQHQLAVEGFSGGRWRPVRITAAEEVSGGPAPPSGGARSDAPQNEAPQSAPPSDAALLAFTGGLDSTAALLRNQSGGNGRLRRPLIGGLLVHGFDIALDQTEQFALARDNAARMLAMEDLPLLTLRTDWRRSTPHWAETFIAAAAACLHQYRGHARRGMLATDLPFAQMITPHGSHPVTNMLLDSHDFALQFELTDIDRAQRAEIVARRPEMADRLRVCFRAADGTALNCGRCEKCNRTRLIFLAAGGPAPASLGQEASMLAILSRGPRTQAQMRSWTALMAAARRNGVTARWVRLLPWVARASMWKYRIRAAQVRMDRVTRPLLRNAGRLLRGGR